MTEAKYKNTDGAPYFQKGKTYLIKIKPTGDGVIEVHYKNNRTTKVITEYPSQDDFNEDWEIIPKK